MNIDVSILESSDDNLVLPVSGEATIEMIAIAFEDGLRNHVTGVLVESANSIRVSDDGNFILTYYPFFSGKRDRVSNTVRYELSYHLRNPVKVSH